MPFASNGPTNTRDLEDKIEKLQRSVTRKWWENTWIQAFILISAVVGFLTLFL